RVHMTRISHRLAGSRNALTQHLTAKQLAKTEILAISTKQVLLNFFQTQQGHQIIQNPGHFNFPLNTVVARADNGKGSADKTPPFAAKALFFIADSCHKRAITTKAYLKALNAPS